MNGNGISTVAHISAISAIIGSLFILLTYSLFPSLRHQGRKLLCFLSVMDLVMAITMVVPSKYCELQGLLGAFSASSSFFWSCGISIYIYVMLFYSKRNARIFCNWLHFVAWGYPAAWSIYMIANKTKFEPTAQSWCFISQDQDEGRTAGFVLRLLVVWGPIWLCVVISLVVNILIWRKFHPGNKKKSNTLSNGTTAINNNINNNGNEVDRTLRDVEEESEDDELDGHYVVIYDDEKLEDSPSQFEIGDNQRGRKGGNDIQYNSQGALLRLMFVPVVFCILRAPGTVNRFYGISHDGDSPSVVTDYLQAFGDPAQGLVNALFFYWTSDKIKAKYLKCICSWWACFVTACQILRSDNLDERYYPQYGELPGSEARHSAVSIGVGGTPQSPFSTPRDSTPGSTPRGKNNDPRFTQKPPMSRYDESIEKLGPPEDPQSPHPHNRSYPSLHSRNRADSEQGEDPDSPVPPSLLPTAETFIVTNTASALPTSPIRSSENDDDRHWNNGQPQTPHQLNFLTIPSNKKIKGKR